MEFTRKIDDHKNGSCQNCGRPSHCGGARWEEVKAYKVDGGELSMIKVCEACRCVHCTDKKEKSK